METWAGASVSWTTIRDLKFDGGRSFTPLGSQYAQSLVINDCSYCNIFYVDFMDSPRIALQISSTARVQVLYSTFTNNHFYGVWSDGPACPYPNFWFPKRCLFVAGSTFTGNGANAIFLNSKQASINSNIFTSNHDESPFNAPGGQVNFAHGADDIWFFYNTVQNGPSSANGWYSLGVELQGKNIDVHHNRIDSNGGEGIFMDSAQNITIRDHKPLYGVNYRIYNNNRKGNNPFPQCAGGFPGVHVHTGQTSTPTSNVVINNNDIYTGHDTGVDVTTCIQPGSAAPISGLSVTNNCLSGNNGGVYVEPGVAPTAVISGNLTSGCP